MLCPYIVHLKWVLNASGFGQLGMGLVEAVIFSDDVGSKGIKGYFLFVVVGYCQKVQCLGVYSGKGNFKVADHFWLATVGLGV